MANKKSIIKEISRKTEITQNDVQKVLETFTELLIDEIKNCDTVKLLNIGTITKTKIFPKNQFSPIDGSTLNTKSYYRITFSASSTLRNCLKEENNKK